MTINWRKIVFSVLLLAMAVALNGTPVFADPPSCPNINAIINPGNQTNPGVPEATVVNGIRTATTVTLDGTNSNPKGGVTCIWSPISGPTVSINNPNSCTATFTAPEVGTSGANLVFQLTVQETQIDCTNKTDSKHTTINITNVNVNSAPTATATVNPATVNEGGFVTLDGSASFDPDGDSLTYAWSQIGSDPTATLINSTSAISTFTAPEVPYPDGASLTFRLTVSDGYLSNSTDKIVNVLWVNDPPIVIISCPASVDEGVPVTLDGSASSDNDGDGIASYVWSQLQGPPTADFTYTNLLNSSITFTAPQLTSHSNTMSFSLTVTDNGIDKVGLSTSSECSVIVKDVTPPAISGADSITAEATSGSGAAVSFNPIANDQVDGDVEVTCDLVSGSTFTLGITTVNCSATDNAGNIASASFTVTVHDTTAPTIAAHDNETAEATSAAGAVVSYISPVTSDLVDGAGTAICSPASGSTFSLGDTAVTCNASDKAGNAAAATIFKVTVQDTTPPVIAAHTDLTVEATSAAGAIVSYISPATSDLVDGAGTAICSPASGSTFPLGDTAVTCNASDKAGNAAAVTTFKVTVQDTTPPVIAAHADVTAEATSSAGAVANYTSPATSDAVDGEGIANCLPISGSIFALGNTTVTCNATDAAGNKATPTTFSVIIIDTTPPVISAHDDVSAKALSSSNATVNYVLPTATDLVDGSVSVSCSPTSGSTFPMGTTPVNCNATDAHGNKAVSKFNVIVTYNWTGFFQPIDNQPVVNGVKAGSAVPVKFSLTGNQGLSIMAAGSPGSAPITCGSDAVEDALIETFTAGSSSLTYDAVADQYVYVWKTDKAWAGTCRQLQVRLKDGSVAHVASFKLTK